MVAQRASAASVSAQAMPASASCWVTLLAATSSIWPRNSPIARPRRTSAISAVVKLPVAVLPLSSCAAVGHSNSAVPASALWCAAVMASAGRPRDCSSASAARMLSLFPDGLTSTPTLPGLSGAERWRHSPADSTSQGRCASCSTQLRAAAAACSEL